MSRTTDHRKRSSVSSLTSTDSMYSVPFILPSLSDSSSFLDPLPPRLYSNDNDIFPSLYEDTDEFRRRCDSVDNFISAQSPGALFNNFPVEEIDYYSLEQRNRSQSLNTARCYERIDYTIPAEHEDIPTQLPDFGGIGESVRYRSQSFSHSSSNYSQMQYPQQQQPPQLIPFTSFSTHLQQQQPMYPPPITPPLSIGTPPIRTPPPPQLIQNSISSPSPSYIVDLSPTITTASNTTSANININSINSLPSMSIQKSLSSTSSSITTSTSATSSSTTYFSQSNQCKYYPNNNNNNDPFSKKGSVSNGGNGGVIDKSSFSHINRSNSINTNNLNSNSGSIISRSMSRDSNFSIESCNNSRRNTRSFSLELPLSSHENFNELIKDQNGCRYLQKKIDEDSVINGEVIYENIKTKINEILYDQFGNYLFQKLYENLKLEYRIEIVESIKNIIYDLSLNPYGTRGIQKIITVDYNCDKIIEIILSIILSNLERIATDSNGNHIIQISLKYFNNKYKNILIDEIISLEHLIHISKAKHGSSVIQLSFIYCNEDQHNIFINNILNNILTLIKDQYGNYIIQYILEHGTVNDKKQIIIKLSGKYYELSRNKVSSNVIEKCVRFCFDSSNNTNEDDVNDNNRIFNMIIDELICNSNFHKLLTDAYANYVIQSALCSENQCILDKLHEAIIPYMKEMKKTSGGRKILSKINKLYKKSA